MGPEGKGTPKGYIVVWFNGSCTVRRRNAGAPATIATFTSQSLATNDELLVTFKNNTTSVDIEVFKNGVCIGSVNDATPPSGLGTHWGFTCFAFSVATRIKSPEMGTP